MEIIVQTQPCIVPFFTADKEGFKAMYPNVDSKTVDGTDIERKNYLVTGADKAERCCNEIQTW